MEYRRTSIFHSARRVVAIAAAVVPAASFALTATPAVEAAYKTYKQTGIVSNELILERVAVLANLKEDCKKNLNAIAFASLSEEHRTELGGGGFVDGLPIASDIKRITNVVRFFSGGMTDAEQGRFAMEVGRGAAVRYRSERCITPAGETPTETNGAALPAALPAAAASVASAASGVSSAASSPAPNSFAVRKVDGIEGWDGEIIGEPEDGSKFQKLKIGMTMVQVADALGPPDDQNFSSTALHGFADMKVGPDRYRSEHVYKGTGRLSFSTEASLGLGEMRLTRISHRREEGTQTSHAEITDAQIVGYESVVEEKCKARGKKQGDSASDTDSFCACMMKTLKENLKKDDWQQATFYFLQNREREEIKVVATQTQKLRACKRGAP